MVLYRRSFVKGGTYFFTVNLFDRKSSLLTQYHEELREVFRFSKNRYSFDIDAIVILPDHLHAIFTLPSDQDDFPGIWKSIKAGFTRRLVKKGVGLPKNKNGQYLVWQRSYWEHTIRDDHDMNQHVDYIHFNPVKHGHVSQVHQWPFSSFHRYVKKGVYPFHWVGIPHESNLNDVAEMESKRNLGGST